MNFPCYEAFKLDNRQAVEYEDSRYNCLIKDIRNNEEDAIDAMMLMSPY